MQRKFSEKSSTLGVRSTAGNRLCSDGDRMNPLAINVTTLIGLDRQSAVGDLDVVVGFEWP
jgi:hypothetical protein